MRDTLPVKMLPTDAEIRLAAGEMTAQELRTAKAVLQWFIATRRYALPEDTEKAREGWKLVPVEPTKEMKQSASEANTNRMRGHFKRILDPECAGWAAELVYRAMLAAAPAPK